MWMPCSHFCLPIWATPVLKIRPITFIWSLIFINGPGNLTSLHIVGGFIQAVEPFEDHNVLLVCNEEAKLLGLPENRFLRNRNGVPYDIIHGTFFLAQGSSEEFCSLTDKQIQTYTRLYSREKLFVMQHGKVLNQPKKGKSTHER